MTTLPVRISYPYDLWIARRRLLNHTCVTKFGHSDTIGTTFGPVAEGNVYRTPQVGAATKLRVRAGNAGDTNGGVGAWKVRIYGINEEGEEVTEELTLAGTSASAETVNNYIRLYRCYVTESGTYADQSTFSHVAAIVIEDTSGNDWATIGVNGIAHGQSTIGVYTVPKGWSAYLNNVYVQAESGKIVDAILFQRQGILDTAAPYKGMRAAQEFLGIEGMFTKVFNHPIPFPELTDIGFMAKVSAQTARVSVDMGFTLVKGEAV